MKTTTKRRVKKLTNEQRKALIIQSDFYFEMPDDVVKKVLVLCEHE